MYADGINVLTGCLKVIFFPVLFFFSEIEWSKACCTKVLMLAAEPAAQSHVRNNTSLNSVPAIKLIKINLQHPDQYTQAAEIRLMFVSNI